MKKIIFLAFLMMSPFSYSQLSVSSGVTATSWQGDYPNYSGTNAWTQLGNIGNASCTTFSCMTILDSASCVSGDSTCNAPFLIGITPPFNIPSNSIITEYMFDMTNLESISAGGAGANMNIQQTTLCADPPPGLTGANISSCAEYGTFELSNNSFSTSVQTVSSSATPASIFGSSLPTIAQVNSGMGIIVSPLVALGSSTSTTIEAGMSGWSLTISYVTIIHHSTVDPVVYHQTRRVHFLRASY